MSNYFVKMPLDYLNALRLRKLRKRDNGDALLIAYLKMVLCGVAEDGAIVYEGVYDSPAEEIAEKINEESDIVEEAIRYSLENNLAVNVCDGDLQGYYFFDSEILTENKGDSTERVKRHREKMKALLESRVTLQGKHVTLHDEDVTKNDPYESACNSELELELDKQLDTEDIVNTSDVNNSEVEEQKEGRVTHRGAFVPPTIDEVKDYIWEKGYHFSADAFMAFYESNGWMVGKNKMKSWKAACRTWEERRKEEDRKTAKENDDIEEWMKRGEGNDETGVRNIFG